MTDSEVLQIRRSMLGLRVATSTGQIGILRGVPNADTIVMQDPVTWREERIVGVAWLEVSQFRCTCGVNTNKLHDGLCADCYRGRAERERAKGPRASNCEECGAPNAYRNPGKRAPEILCTRCHTKNGTLPHDFNIITRVQAAACRASDIDDMLHAWKKIKSSRWVCTKCQVHRYTPPPTMA